MDSLIIFAKWRQRASDLTNVPWASPSLYRKRHLDRCSRLCTAHCRMSLYFTMGAPFHSKLPLRMEDLDPHLIHDFSAPPEFTTQPASRSVHVFFQGSQPWQTDRPTDRKTDHAISVCINRPHLRSTAMPPKSKLKAPNSAFSKNYVV